MNHTTGHWATISQQLATKFGNRFKLGSSDISSDATVM